MRNATVACSLFTSVAFVSLCGCTSRSQVFEGYGDDQLWTAMVATARTPEYGDWLMSDNEVFVDEAGRRIEIYRTLRRTLVSPYAEPRREDAEWRFQIELEAEDGTPVVDFTARQIAVPAHVWSEADRYFAQMRTLLGAPRPTQSTPDAAPEATPKAAPEAMPSAESTPPAEAPAAAAPTAAEPKPAPAQPEPIEPLPE